MEKDSRVSDDDIALFHNTIGAVTPIKKQGIIHKTKRSLIRPRQREINEQVMLQELHDGGADYATLESNDKLLYMRPGVQKRTMRRLQRGQYPIEENLDLHGMTVDVAREALASFLRVCRQRSRHCVMVIHGKGLGSKHGKPIIKNMLNNWLQQCDGVLAYCSARQVDGGTGATYLLLKKR